MPKNFRKSELESKPCMPETGCFGQTQSGNTGVPGGAGSEGGAEGFDTEKRAISDAGK